jgi:hypothetical protein
MRMMIVTAECRPRSKRRDEIAEVKRLPPTVAPRYKVVENIIVGAHVSIIPGEYPREYSTRSSYCKLLDADGIFHNYIILIHPRQIL